jgi:hypothetical protein
MRLDTQPDSLHVRPVYIGPASYDTRRVDVSIRGMAACKTREDIPSLTVGLLGMPADAALPGSITRIDVADGNAYACGLVDDLVLEIAKGPRVKDATKRPGSSYPITDAIEVFDGDTARGAFGRSDNLLRDTMIHVAGETVLLFAPFAKQPLRTFGSLLLEPPSESVSSTPKTVQVCAGEIIRVAGGGDVDDTDVDPQPVEDFLLLDIRHVDGDEQVEVAVTKNEIGLASVVCEKFPLMVAADEPDTLAAIDCPEAHSVVPPRQNARVVRDSTERPKASFGLTVKLVRIGHFGNTAHDDLRGQIREFGPTFVVSEFVDGELPKRLCGPGPCGEPTASLIRTAHRRSEYPSLFDARLEPHLGRQLHVPTVPHSSMETKRGFLPALKDGVSAPKIR